MATGVFKHREGNWGFRANVPNGAGKQIERVGFSTMLAAYAARAKFLGSGETPTGSDLTVGEWFERRLEVIRETHRPTTASNYKFTFDRIRPHLGEIRLCDLDEDMIRAMYRKMATRYTTDTLTTTHGRLRATLRAAVREHRVGRCAADNVTPPPGLPKRVKKTWTFEQLMQFSAHVKTQRDRAQENEIVDDYHPVVPDCGQPGTAWLASPDMPGWRYCAPAATSSSTPMTRERGQKTSLPLWPFAWSPIDVERFGVGYDGGVVDTERVLAWKTIFDDGQLCTHSPHPDHIPCDAPAHYVISWVDLAHKQTFHPAACFRHASWYFRCALNSEWCTCAPAHRHCPSAGVRLDRLR